MSEKSDEDVPTETLEQHYISFIKDRLEKHGILNLQNLTGHLSALPASVRSKFGTSKSCLKKFIKEHPESFKLDRKENVDVASMDKYNRLDSISTDDGIAIQKLVDEMEEKSKEKDNSASGEVPHPRNDLPFELKEIKGKIYRLFQVYGFITVKNPRLQASVYFDLQAFEHGKLESFTDGKLKIGQGVFLNARKGPDSCEAQYRASLVFRPESTEYFSVRNGSNDSDVKEISGCGKIHNIFPTYGFIARNTLVKDNVFFHVNSLVIPNEKEVKSLLDAFKIGDLVKFHGVPSEQKEANIKWQATHVWLDTSCDSDSKDGNDIFISDSDCYDSASDRNDEDEFDEPDENRNSPATPEDGNHSNKHPQMNSNPTPPSSSSLSPIALPFYSSHVLPAQGNGEIPKKLSNQFGILAAKTKDLAIIIFGERYMHRSLTSSDVMYINGERIKDFLLALGENEKVQFDAVFQANGIYDCNWKTTLAWMGKKPDPSENIHSTPILPVSDWASVVEIEQRQLESNSSQSSDTSPSAVSFLSQKLSPFQNENLSNHSAGLSFSVEKPKTPSPNSLYSQDSKMPLNKPTMLNPPPPQSRFASQFNFHNQENGNLSRISAQTFPMGLFSMSSAPPGCVGSFPHYQSKSLLQSSHPNSMSSYAMPQVPLAQTIHPPTSSHSGQSSMLHIFNNDNHSSSNAVTNQNSHWEQKFQELSRQVEAMKQHMAPVNSSDRTVSKAKCFKEMGTQTIDSPCDDRSSHFTKSIHAKHSQTYSTGTVMFSELYLDN